MRSVATFATQAEAVAHRRLLLEQRADAADEMLWAGSRLPLSVLGADEQLFVFAAEYADDAASSRGRYFFVASVEQTWQALQETAVNRRFFYELIEEGAPCHAYFDVECNVTIAPPIPAILQAFADAINCSGIMPANSSGQRLRVETSDIVLLRSLPVVNDKFSLHLIIRFPASPSRSSFYVFPNNAVMGRWVREIITPLVLASLGAPAELIDIGVYTRNRTFRTAGSRKKAKESFFVPCAVHHTEAGDFVVEQALTRALFEASLITNMHACSVLPERSLRGYAKSAECRPMHGPAGAHQSMRSSYPAKSFHPVIDAFVRETIDDYRTIFRTGDENVVCYALKNLRYCGNIGREHKSNGTYVVVNLSDWIFYQRCFDAACKSYRGAPVDIPPEVRAAFLENR